MYSSETRQTDSLHYCADADETCAASQLASNVLLSQSVRQSVSHTASGGVTIVCWGGSTRSNLSTQLFMKLIRFES